MNNLLYFFIKSRPWILLVVYVLMSCVLLFNGNPYQHSIYLTSANAVSSSIYGMSTGITGYFNLRDINEDLQHRNSDLELELLNLKATLRKYQEVDYAMSTPVDSSLSRYNFIIAHVINNSVNRPHNFITIEKGSEDGIKPEMGVVDQNGVVGKINVVGPHSSRIISLLNSDLRISCKIKSSRQIGSLVWNGKNHREAVLEEIPRHTTFNKGDTIVTSGYSTSFPEGVPVGVIIDRLTDYDDNFYALRIKLFTDFSTLGTVRVIVDNMTDELKEVESDNEHNK